MWPFRPSREGSTALTSQRTPEQTAEYLCRLMEEQNALMRVLVTTMTGHLPNVPKAAKPALDPLRIRTDKDVFRVTRQDLLTREQEAREQAAAPWRTTPGNGQASASSSTSAGADTPASAPPKATPPSPNGP